MYCLEVILERKRETHTSYTRLTILSPSRPLAIVGDTRAAREAATMKRMLFVVVVAVVEMVLLSRL